MLAIDYYAIKLKVKFIVAINKNTVSLKPAVFSLKRVYKRVLLRQLIDGIYGGDIKIATKIMTSTIMGEHLRRCTIRKCC